MDPHHRSVGAKIAVVPLNGIPYVDYPELHIDEHESTEMPFRYVADDRGSPVMPEVRHYIAPLIKIEIMYMNCVG